MANDRCSSVFIIQEMHGEHQLSNYATLYETQYISSGYAYNDIANNIKLFIDEAIPKRGTY